MKKCPICKQKMDIYTTVHKKAPFIDGKNYDMLCFTCFFVPKIQKQKYDKNGYIIEQIELDYCCDNLSSAQELYQQGSSDTLKNAKISVESVKKLCSGIKLKKPIYRPKPEWNILNSM